MPLFNLPSLSPKLPLTPPKAVDAYFMGLALALARRGIYTARPNPAVGCVLVRDEVVIGEGFHPKAGEPHAEIFALQNAKHRGENPQGATAYVTLEPCSHTGRTPPCCDALIKAGVARVVVACLDPNPKVAGQGVTRLLQAGIAVTVGVCQDDAIALNQGFLKAMATGLPYVRLKTAISLDGRTAMKDGSSKWITGDQARADVQTLRALSGAVITGSGTVMADDPALSVRSQMLGVPIETIPQPKVVVVDRQHRLTADSPYQVFGRADTLLWRDDLLSLLHALAGEYQCYDVLVEAGAVLAGAFIEQGLIDELIIYQAPCLLGHQARAMVEMDITKLCEQKRFSVVSVSQMGADIKYILRPLHKIRTP